MVPGRRRDLLPIPRCLTPFLYPRSMCNLTSAQQRRLGSTDRSEESKELSPRKCLLRIRLLQNRSRTRLLPKVALVSFQIYHLEGRRFGKRSPPEVWLPWPQGQPSTGTR